MRGNLMNDLLLNARFMHKPNTALGQIAQSAVQQPARTAARPEGEIVLFHQRHAQAAHRPIAGNAGTHNTTADDQNIYVSVLQGGEGRRSLCNGLAHTAFASRSISPSSLILGIMRSGAGLYWRASSKVVSPVSTSTPTAPAH